MKLLIVTAIWKWPLKYLEMTVSSVRESDLDAELVVAVFGSDSYVGEAAEICEWGGATLVRRLTPMPVPQLSVMRNLALRTGDAADFVLDVDCGCALSPGMSDRLALLLRENRQDRLYCFDVLFLEKEEGGPERNGCWRFCREAVERRGLVKTKIERAEVGWAEVLSPYKMCLKVRGWPEGYMGWGYEDKDMCAVLCTWGLDLYRVCGKDVLVHLWHPALRRASRTSQELWRRREDERRNRKNCLCNERFRTIDHQVVLKRGVRAGN